MDVKYSLVIRNISNVIVSATFHKFPFPCTPQIVASQLPASVFFENA